MEYRGVWVRSGDQVFHNGPLEDGTNNVGEFLAIVHAAAWLKSQGRTETIIYSDSVNAINWVAAKVCRTKLQRTSENEEIFDLIARALKWLKENQIENPIMKWETQDWGENPADFGRK
jgi:ribonuclease HI